MSHLSKYVQYIRNVGRPVKFEEFDDDWEPIGPMIRKDLVAAGFCVEEDGCIKEKGA